MIQCPKCGSENITGFYHPNHLSDDLPSEYTCHACDCDFTTWQQSEINRLQERIRVLDEGPKIICLCGSTRFKEQFDEWNYIFTCAGVIVLTVGFFVHSLGEHGESIGCTPALKIKLDELHKRKIDLAHEVFVINVGRYIGESTRSEIEYATKLGKPIKYLEPSAALEAEIERKHYEKSSD